jgi:glycine/D-amino acid oxidase-like deaminating enzyme
LVVGGGCAGIWLAHDFAKLGYKTLLLEHGPLAQYASQGNQGWLHSGALYGVFESEQITGGNYIGELRATARECGKGYVRLRRFSRRHCKKAIDNRSGCMFLYDDDDKAERAQHVLQSYGLEPQIYRSNLELLEPILVGSRAHTALVTRDLPFDAGLMLNAVARRAVAMGGQFVDSTEPLEQFRFMRDGERWVVRDGSLTLTSPVVVCATGALVLRQQQTLGFFRPIGGIQKCEVVVFDTRICNRILSFRISQARELSIVPSRGRTTLNLNAMDTCTPDLSSDPDDHEAWCESLADVLSLCVPGTKQWRVPIRAHTYVCQKVANGPGTSRPLEVYGKRHYFWAQAEEKPGLYYAYPGKFTLSANCSRALVNHILDSGLLRRPATEPRIISTRGPLIGASPYRTEPTHVLAQGKDGELRFVHRTV